MTDKEAMLYEIMQDFTYYENRAKEIRKRLESRSYKITASFSLTGGIGGNGFTSKVETAAIEELKLLGELAEIEKKKDIVFSAMRKASLTKTEQGIADCIMAQQDLSAFARNNGIYSSYVYKIRDRMLKKMAKFV